VQLKAVFLRQRTHRLGSLVPWSAARYHRIVIAVSDSTVRSGDRTFQSTSISGARRFAASWVITMVWIMSTLMDSVKSTGTPCERPATLISTLGRPIRDMRTSAHAADGTMWRGPPTAGGRQHHATSRHGACSCWRRRRGHVEAKDAASTFSVPSHDAGYPLRPSGRGCYRICAVRYGTFLQLFHPVTNGLSISLELCLPSLGHTSLARHCSPCFPHARPLPPLRPPAGRRVPFARLRHEMLSQPQSRPVSHAHPPTMRLDALFHSDGLAPHEREHRPSRAIVDSALIDCE